jgi:hypothetical protein
MTKTTTKSRTPEQKTARDKNRAPGEVVHILPVPLIDDRQMHYLHALAIFGNIGETPEEVAAFMIMEGIGDRMRNGLLVPRTEWKGFKP